MRNAIVTDLDAAAASPDLAALSARLDFVARLAEERGVVDSEDGIPSRGGAVWPSTHPRWIAFLDLLIARGFAPAGTFQPGALRAELVSLAA
jgi:hypothetical protein